VGVALDKRRNWRLESASPFVLSCETPDAARRGRLPRNCEQVCQGGGCSLCVGAGAGFLNYLSIAGNVWTDRRKAPLQRSRRFPTNEKVSSSTPYQSAIKRAATLGTCGCGGWGGYDCADFAQCGERGARCQTTSTYPAASGDVVWVSAHGAKERFRGARDVGAGQD